MQPWPIQDLLELAELVLKVGGQDVLDRLEAEELTLREALAALRRRVQ